MIWLRSVLFTTLMFLSVLPWSVVVIIGRLFGEGMSYRLVVMWTQGNLWLCKRLCRLDYRVEGRHHIPVDGNHVALIKHSSAYETLAQMLLFPRQAWVLKRELELLPFFGWALATVRPIGINRGAGRAAVEQVMEQGAQRLAAGRWIMIFPEGTRMPAGQTRRYGISGTLLAQKNGRLLIPVAHDAGFFWPRRGWRKHPGTITFRIGAPVDPAGRDPRAVNEEIQAWIEAQVAELRAHHPQG